MGLFFSYKYNNKDIAASMMLAYPWLTFNNMTLFTMCIVTCAQTSNIESNTIHINMYINTCYVWSMALYGAETWTLRATDQKRLESFEMWCWRRMEKISWTDHVRN